MTPRIKVLHIVGSSSFGGAAQHILSLCSRLNRTLFHLSCICPEDGPLPSKLRPLGVTVKTVDLYKYVSPTTWTEVITELRREHPSILHTHGASAFLFGAIGALVAGTPILINTFHGLHLQRKQETMTLTSLGRIKLITFLTLERWATHRASCLVFVSESDRQKYYSQTADRGRGVTIPNGVDLGRFAPIGNDIQKRRDLGLPLSARIVGSVARLDLEKGIDSLLRASPTILQSHPDTFVLVVGEGPQRKGLETMAHDLGISGRVIFTGFREDVPELLSLMDVFVLPSLWEGHPITILEAWALEKPVVATSVESTKYLIEDGKTGILVPTREAQTIAQAVIGLLDNPQRARQLGAAGRQKVEADFTLERMVERIEKLYLELWHSKDRQPLSKRSTE